MNVKDQITTLSTVENERSESIAQSLDILAQVLESIDTRLTGQDREIRRSFGDHSRNLQQLQAPKEWQDILGEIRTHRKTINALEPKEAKVRKLITLVAQLIDMSNSQNVVYQRRVRYRPHLVNTVGLETPTGFGQFQLYHGSVIQMPCDVLIVSGRLM
jgi:hypothetical protein